MKSCPQCKSNMIIDIVYGYPGDELQDEASRGKVKLGGCLIEPDNPEYRCKSCGHEFGGLDKFLNDEFINDDLWLRYEKNRFFLTKIHYKSRWKEEAFAWT